jgi:hypothetical protein
VSGRISPIGGDKIERETTKFGLPAGQSPKCAILAAGCDTHCSIERTVLAPTDTCGKLSAALIAGCSRGA